MALTECPMRVLRHPGVMDYLTLFARFRTTGALPGPGGLEDQAARDLDALECMSQALAEYQQFQRVSRDG